MSTYACSDIHGQFDAWLDALVKSNIDLSSGDELIILGDLIDRGEDSLACVEMAFELMDRYPRQVTYLMGNHEKMFLDFVTTNPESPNGYIDMMITGSHWFQNGGFATASSFLNEVGLERDNFYAVRSSLIEKQPDLIKRLIKLPYYKVDEELNCVYVHAGFRSNRRLEDQYKEDMLWIREAFFKSFIPVKGDVLEGKLIVHGHTPVQYMPDYQGEGFYQGKHHIGIDGGAAAGNSVLVVKMDDLSYVEEKIEMKEVL
ncbi:serine/threonine protein phosphatase 1 [Bacillus thermophilus]|uniref:Serine/threonine protein phosphatase n=2 Tax=Siminovitchia TaxID=2837510 RepID=A0A429X9Y3_SIMTE|nr:MULTISPECIES: metallophosphoesterase family protein [Siminovitchia]MBM7716068.1 serine/threonine protein phosphatase 1 [Siminovitchia thermophila]RST60172.1 serine/threonine protein phosphatase [Siminovitchia terrae]